MTVNVMQACRHALILELWKSFCLSLLEGFASEPSKLYSFGMNSLCWKDLGLCLQIAGEAKPWPCGRSENHNLQIGMKID